MYIDNKIIIIIFLRFGLINNYTCCLIGHGLLPKPLDHHSNY